ncbi:MAG: leucine-rich repeat protein [Bacteroidaceae bacterium]|nr:leucine-rich repeat protein [Bacteroidaceae bacterium]
MTSKMRSFLTCLLLWLPLASSSLLRAYELEVDGVYIGIIGSHFAYVTNRDYSTLEPSYSGDVVVPEQVVYEGRTYNIVSVGPNAFYCCEGLRSVKLPSTVKAISASAFLGCTGLQWVDMPAGLQGINYTAFAACTSLKQISLPRGTELVDSMTFYCCASLPSIILPHRVRTVCSTSMQHLCSLSDLYVFASAPPLAEQGAFTLDDQKHCTLHVPAETLQKYKQAAVWQDFASIVPLTDKEYTDQGYQRGDVNDDGAVDAADLDLLQRIIVNLPDDSAVRWAADINEDGKVNAIDYVLFADKLSHQQYE